MSLPKDPDGPIPEETIRIAQAAFPKDNIYMKMQHGSNPFPEIIHDSPRSGL
jgi:hypothetical protein